MLDEGELTAYLDEHLDDPDAADVAGGIPDPVLAEIGAERTGAMREIVATIQAEQDLVIRAPIDQVLVVQGGPGTGKTAVALHRAAYLLFEHRRRLARDGVLVIGPNRAFLDYVGNVLPSLGERSVRQCTVLDLCVPKVEITGVDDPAAARAKGDVGDARRAASSPRCSASRRRPSDVVVPIGVRRHRVHPRRDRASGSTGPPTASIPFNQRRQRLRAIAQQELRRRTDRDDAWPDAGAAAQGARRGVADAAADPPRRPPAARAAWPQRAWTAADQLLVDEANSILNGPPLVYGHVVVDEAQDHSAVALRVIGRRSPAASMTLVGDVAQSTTPAGQERWADVFAYLVGRRGGAGGEVAELTIGYRVPEPILTVANRLLPLTGVDASASRSVRVEGHAPSWTHTSPAELAGDGRRGGRSAEAPPPADRRRRPARAPRGDRRRARRRRAARRRPPPPAAPRRGAAVRAGAGQGPRVRRRGRRRARRDPRRHAARRPPALRRDDPRRAGAGVRHDVGRPAAGDRLTPDGAGWRHVACGPWRSGR